MIDKRLINKAIKGPEGKQYKDFFINLSNKNPEVRLYSFLTTNYTCAEYLLAYYDINRIDMQELYECVSEDPDILDLESPLFSELNRIIGCTWNRGNRIEKFAEQQLRKREEVTDVHVVSGYKSKTDMFDKIDLVVKNIKGDEYPLQVKPASEEKFLSDSDFKTKADYFMFVDLENETYYIKNKRKLMNERIC